MKKSEFERLYNQHINADKKQQGFDKEIMFSFHSQTRLNRLSGYDQHRIEMDIRTHCLRIRPALGSRYLISGKLGGYIVEKHGKKLVVITILNKSIPWMGKDMLSISSDSERVAM